MASERKATFAATRKFPAFSYKIDVRTFLGGFSLFVFSAAPALMDFGAGLQTGQTGFRDSQARNIGAEETKHVRRMGRTSRVSNRGSCHGFCSSALPGPQVCA